MRRQVNFISGRRQNNHRRYCPNTQTNSGYNNSNYNNQQSPEIRTMDAQRNQITDQQTTINETADQSNSLANSSQQPLN